jgi:hypothetical protein
MTEPLTVEQGTALGSSYAIYKCARCGAEAARMNQSALRYECVLGGSDGR